MCPFPHELASNMPEYQRPFWHVRNHACMNATPRLFKILWFALSPPTRVYSQQFTRSTDKGIGVTPETSSA